MKFTEILTPTVLSLLLFSALVALAALTWWLQRPPMMRRRVLFNLASDPSLAVSGVLVTTRGQWFVLADAAVVRQDGSRTAALGPLVVHRGNVSFGQLLTDGDRRDVQIGPR